MDPCGLIVGINTANLPEAQNIGFAVPVDLIKGVVPQLIEKGHVVRPWLGVQGQFVAPALQELLRIPLADGFLVEAVEPGSPAERKGLRGGLFEIMLEGQPLLLGGDIITQVNGVAMDDPAKLADTLGDLHVGSSLKLSIVREGKPQTIELTLDERPVLLWDMPGRQSASTFDASRTGGRRRAAGRVIVF